MRFRLASPLVALAAAGTVTAGVAGLATTVDSSPPPARVRAAAVGAVRPVLGPAPPRNDIPAIKDAIVANADPAELSAHPGPPPPPPPPKPEPKPAVRSAPAVSNGSVWDRLARCESGGDWASTAGTFEGGLQFHPSTWDAHKPAGYPNHAYQATRTQQILVAKRVLADQGWAAWPACSRKLGLR